MCNETSLESIESGVDLPPINTQPSNDATSGLTTENRGFETSGLRYDIFTLNSESGADGGE